MKKVKLASDTDINNTPCTAALDAALLSNDSLAYAEISGHQESDGVQKDIL